MHEPQTPTPQPSRLPRRRKSSRNQSNKVWFGLTEASTSRPLMIVRIAIFMVLLRTLNLRRSVRERFRIPFLHFPFLHHFQNPIRSDREVFDAQAVQRIRDRIAIAGSTGPTPFSTPFAQTVRPDAASPRSPIQTPVIVETPHPDGPFGAKGVGEAALGPVEPAIGNAVANALNGLRIKDLRSDRIGF